MKMTSIHSDFAVRGIFTNALLILNIANYNHP